MQVTWYINGRLVVDDATHKVLVNETGNHSLMIQRAALSDAGTISCVARNKSGEATCQVSREWPSKTCMATGWDRVWKCKLVHV